MNQFISQALSNFNDPSDAIIPDMTPISKAINSYINREPNHISLESPMKPSYMKPKKQSPRPVAIQANLYKTGFTFNTNSDDRVSNDPHLGVKGINIEKSNLLMKVR